MQKFFKKAVALTIAIVMVFSSTAMVRANQTVPDPSFIPIREYFEALDAEVNWLDEQVVVSLASGDTWVFIPGAHYALVNEVAFINMTYPVFISDGFSMISAVDLMHIMEFIHGMTESADVLVDEQVGEPLYAYAAYFSQTIATAVATAEHFMAAVAVPGLTMAIVDAETGFTWTRGFGYADSVAGVLADEHTLFQVGSTSKPFTAIAVMQLVEQGLINLDNPLVYYIPEFSLMPGIIAGGYSDDVTVRMLMNMTSGVPTDYFYRWFALDEHYQGNMNNVLDWLSGREMLLPGGMAYVYNNTNWTLLGILVARVMGHENYFEGFVQHTHENIFAPLGMNRSTFEFTHELTNVAMPYVADGQDVMHTVSPIAAGGLLSSANDMAIFMHLLLNGGEFDGTRIIDAATIDYMMQIHTPVAVPLTGYGLGFIHFLFGELETVGHGGNIAHYHTEMVLHRETGLGVFVSTNSVSGVLIAADLAILTLVNAIEEKTGSAPLLQVEVPATETIETNVYPIELTEEELTNLAQFEGIYIFDNMPWRFEITDGVPAWWFEEISLELTPLSDGTFEAITGIYSFFEYEGMLLTTLTTITGDFFQVVRLTDEELALLGPPEGFAELAGVYNFVPRADGDLSLIHQIIVSYTAMGTPQLTFVQHIHTYLGVAAGPIFEVDGNWFFVNYQVIFFTDADGNPSINLHGAIYVME